MAKNYSKGQEKGGSKVLKCLEEEEEETNRIN